MSKVIKDIIQKSEYVAMRDGTRLAVDVWLPGDYTSTDRLPGIFMTTRYWRAAELYEDKPEMQMSIYPSASYFTAQGCALVIADARGSGASFGSRSMELGPEEVSDMGELLDWASKQTWSNGRFAGFGLSYGGNTTFMAATNRHPALKIIAPQFADFDIYTQLYCPGGIANEWMKQSWGQSTRNMDSNDFAAMVKGQPSEELFLKTAKGVRPVDEDKDGSLLALAIAEHKGNFNVALAPSITFKDDKAGKDLPSTDERALYRYRSDIEASGLPIFYRAAWHDAGTAEGALNLFTTFSNPMRVVIGPWNHGMTHIADPYAADSDKQAQEIPASDMLAGVLDWARPYIDDTGQAEEINDKQLDYYTLGENCWKSTKVWPLPETRYRSLYLSDAKALKQDASQDATGHDKLHVNAEGSIGENSRWHTQMSGPVLFPDRSQADESLLYYQTAPLDKDLEITGHPRAKLYLRSDCEDGFFFLYLEDVDQKGVVKMLSDGYLRALHRKVSREPAPYKIFGPYHSYKQRDALKLVPGEIAELDITLFPVSVRLKKGHRLRFTLSGSGVDIFQPVPGCETPELTVERNKYHPSHIVLPVIT